MIRPLNDRILVKRVEDTTDSTIIIPDVAKEPSFWGQVVAVGPGRRTKSGNRIPVSVQPGDVVLFGKFTDFDKDDLVLIQEGDIRVVKSA